MNGGIMTTAVNGMIQSEINVTKGQMPVGMIEALLFLFP